MMRGIHSARTLLLRQNLPQLCVASTHPNQTSRSQISNHVVDPNTLWRFRFFSSQAHRENGLVKATIEDILKGKEDDATGSLFCCYTHDTVHNAAKKMIQHNVGALVVLKPGEKKLIKGIITERDYLRKVVVQERPAKTTKVQEIMTAGNKLVTVASDTNVLHAMQLMTDHGIRHVPVIDGKMVVGLVSIRDVVRVVVEEQQEEMKHLSDFIWRGY